MPTSNSFDVTALLRPEIANLRPYSSARSEFLREESVNVAQQYCLLDANENSFGSVQTTASDNSTTSGLHRYPDPYQLALKRDIAALWSTSEVTLSSAQLFLGNGSDEAIDLLVRAFCRPAQDRILVCSPSYGMYRVSADIQGVGVETVALRADAQLGPSLVVDDALQRQAKVKLSFLCSPNNPTGAAIPLEAIATLAHSVEGLVIVDEAYIDFCPEKSALPLVQEHKNLVLLRTFSKAWGLAGVRLGAAIASPEIIAVLNKIKAPYNVNQLTQDALSVALTHASEMQEFVTAITAERKRLYAAFAELPCVTQVFPSDANFLLVRFRDASTVFQALRAAGIIVRDRSNLAGCEQCLRITIGTPAQNNALLAVLAEQ